MSIPVSHRLRAVSLAVGLCSLIAVARAEDDLWVLDGNPLCTAVGGQTQPVMCSDGAGGAFVAWEDRRAGDRIFLTRVTGSGAIATGWPTDGISVSSLPSSDEYDQVLMPDGAGGVYVAWSDGRDPTGSASYVKRLAADGTVAPGWPTDGLLVSGYFQSPAVLLPDGAGGVLVIVSEYFSGPDVIDLFAHHALAGGTLDPAWPAAGRSLLGSQPEVRSGMAYSDGSGGLFVPWTSGLFPNPNPVSRILHFGGDGIADLSWPSSGLVLGSGSAEGLVLDGSGGGYVCFAGHRAADSGLYLQRFTAAGALVSGWDPSGVPLCTAPVGQSAPFLVSDGASGVIAAWSDFRDGFDDDNIYCRRVSGNGTSPPGWDSQGNRMSSAPSSQEIKGLISDSQGGAIACWVDHRGVAATLTDIYAQRIGASGSPAPGWPEDGRELCTNASDQDLSVLATDGAGGAIVAWRDHRNSDDQDIYAARVRSDAVTPVLVAVARSEVAPDHVRVVWRLATWRGESVVVERAAQNGGWEPRSTLVVDGSDEATYEDRDVIPGARYGYRLVVGGVDRLGETWFQIPESAGFALRGLVPNPARGALVAFVTLPGFGSGRLEVFDTSGRCVITRELDGLGPGEHRVGLGASRDLAPGVYLLLLRGGGRSVSARACVLE